MKIFGRKEKTKNGRRETRFAGTWYDDDPAKLKTQLGRYLDDAKQIIDEDHRSLATSTNSLYAIIAPHAGYMFSGATAACSYEFASGFAPKRVFLLGPSHYVGFHGIALSPDSVFATPLGDLSVDRSVIDELSRYPMFEESPEVHKKEHSLELQLSFIRQTFGEVPLVPLIVGQLPDVSDVKMVGQIIRRYIKEGDIVVVSSDFTHYGPRYDYVPFDCDVAAEKVRELDEAAFDCLRTSDLDAFIDFHDRTQCTICGFYPCALLLSMLPSSARGSLLQYRTSRDTTFEDAQNSVSYLAIAFTGRENEGWEAEPVLNKEELLTESEKSDLLNLARKAVEVYVRERRIIKEKDAGIALTPSMMRHLGAFVTLFKKRHGEDPLEHDTGHHNRELRGCIGYIWPIKMLWEAVIDNAIGACSKDPRFNPVQEADLEDLQVEISVLTPLRPVESVEEIEIGRHGVVLYLKGRQSVFLPHVATEFGWTRDETLGQLAQKAGFATNDWRSGAKFDIFESVMFEESI